MKIKTTYIIIAFLVALLLLETTCNSKTEERVKVVVKTKIKTDTITKTFIKEVPKEVIVNKYIDKEGEKVIVYVDTPNDTSIVAKQYDTQLKANNATADIKITTTGQLLDVTGVITYPKETTTLERTIYKNKSAFFIYGKMPISSQLQTPELGVMYNFRNKLIIGTGAQLNNLTNEINATVTLAVKL